MAGDSRTLLNVDLAWGGGKKESATEERKALGAGRKESGTRTSAGRALPSRQTSPKERRDLDLEVGSCLVGEVRLLSGSRSR